MLKEKLIMQAAVSCECWRWAKVWWELVSWSYSLSWESKEFSQSRCAGWNGHPQVKVIPWATLGCSLAVARALPFVLSLKYSGHSLVSYLESGCSFLSPGPSRPFSSSVLNHSDLQLGFIHRQDIFSPLSTLSFNLAFLLGVTCHRFLVLSLYNRLIIPASILVKKKKNAVRYGWPELYLAFRWGYTCVLCDDISPSLSWLEIPPRHTT